MSNTDKIEHLLKEISSRPNYSTIEWDEIHEVDGHLAGVGIQAAPQIRALLDENRELWRMLQSLEWANGCEPNTSCHFCGYTQNPSYHASHCQLSALLSRKPKDL